MVLALLASIAFAAVDPIDAQAIVQIEAQRLPPQSLAQFVSDDDVATRKRAAQALGRMRSWASLPMLRTLIRDASPEVRRHAAYALGQTPGAAELLLMQADSEDDPVVRAALFNALGTRGTGFAVGSLVSALDESPPVLRSPIMAREASVALGRLAMRGFVRARSPAVVNKLLDQLGRFDRDTRRGAAFALGRIGPEALAEPENVRLLEAAAHDRDPVVRSFLLRATATLEISKDRLARLYGLTLKDSNTGVRVATLRAGARSGWKGVAAALDDPDPAVRREAISAVGKVTSLDQVALLAPIVVRGAPSVAQGPTPPQSGSVLVEAAAALSALDVAGLWTENDAARQRRTDVGLEATLAMYLLQTRPVAVRAAAASVSPDVEALLHLAIHDEENLVRISAAERMASLNPHPAWIAELLYATDPMVQSAACEWFSERPATQAAAPLVKALKKAEHPALLRTVSQALLPLARNASTARLVWGARADVARLLDHWDPTVRASASKLAVHYGLPAAQVHHQIVTAPLADVATRRTARIITSRGTAIVELFPEVAPVTVWNFTQLAEKKFFDDLTFHRVVADFVVQGGDPRGDGWGGPGYTIPDEINPNRFEEGTVGMALSGPDTGGSQFFVTMSPQPHLENGYTAFGRVTQGMQVFRSIQPGDRIETIIVERLPTPAEKAANAQADLEAGLSDLERLTEEE